ncbi:carboxymuconolactone decarboxylase family protein [Actinoallomurus vinaceus]|uniref:Carboxymuconolactone decarboxylase family protein n=2 Tax=Actinoallomurus vinaceus TaxID=1080074 RepID=A0ABP8U3F7_9ACTN
MLIGMRLPLIEPETADAETADLMAAMQRTAGVTPNMVKAMANSPATLRGYLGFIVALRDGGDLPAPVRARIALLVAQEYGSDYCLSAHTYLGVNLTGLSAAEAARARAGESDDPVSAAALAFATALLRTGGDVTDDDLAAADLADLAPGQRVEIVAQVVLGVLCGLLTKAGRIDNDWPLVSHTD